MFKLNSKYNYNNMNTSTDLRLEKDLLELKKFHMTTNLFTRQYSDLIKDVDNNTYRLDLLLIPNHLNFIYKVRKIDKISLFLYFKMITLTLHRI